MTQTRLFFSAPKGVSDRIFHLLEREFEEDGYALAAFETGPETQTYEISVYIDEEQDDSESVQTRIQGHIATLGQPFAVEREVLPDIDWVAKSLEGLKPVRAGRFLVHGAHDREKIRTNDIAVEIEAGQAFGTGHHGTTAGCLDMLERLCRIRAPRAFLDLGTGSGVLAIAAAKRSKCRVLATDIDPVATTVARANAALNGVSDHIRFQTAAGFGHRAFIEEAPFDLIVANILARPLMALAPAIEANLAPGGQVILSGILARQRQMVLSAFRIAGLFHRQTIWRDEWVTLHLCR